MEARASAERWGAWKGFAAYYLEVADLLGIDPKNSQKYEKHPSTNGNGAVESLCLYSDGNL